jgi:hypothetical protein
VNSRRTAIVALTALTASGCGVGVHFADYRHTVTPADTHVAGPVSDLQLNAGDGHVTITTGGDGVSIHRVVHYQSGTPHPGQQLTNGALTFSKGCSRCRIDYDLTVPSSVRVKADTDSGRIDIAGVASAEVGSDSGSVTVRQVAGGVTAHSDSGSITLDDIGGTLETHTDSGSVRATGLRSPVVTTSSDSGSIRLDFVAAPRDVHGSNDSGSLRLALPGGPYNVDVKTDSGGKQIDVPTASAASSTLSLHTDSGSVSVVPA